MMKNMKAILASVAVAAVAQLVVSQSASAAVVGFTRITNNGASNVAGQLTVDVSDAGSGQVLFNFENAGPLDSTIKLILFDDGSLSILASLIEGAGVDFTQVVGSPNLPGGNTASPPFDATPGFGADADPPPAMNGVDPGESLGILFDLQGGKVFDDLITELTNGDLRIGMHVISLPDGESDSFINTPIPEPATAVLLLAGAVGTATRLRRRGSS